MMQDKCKKSRDNRQERREEVRAENSGVYNLPSFGLEDLYHLDPSQPDISLTLPKSRKEHHSDVLFPFFANMVSEGVNLRLQSLHWNIDEEDLFGMLGATARCDTIGAVTVSPVEEA